jgi:hypothetical protein
VTDAFEREYPPDVARVDPATRLRREQRSILPPRPRRASLQTQDRIAQDRPHQRTRPAVGKARTRLRSDAPERVCGVNGIGLNRNRWDNPHRLHGLVSRLRRVRSDGPRLDDRLRPVRLWPLQRAGAVPLRRSRPGVKCYPRCVGRKETPQTRRTQIPDAGSRNPHRVVLAQDRNDTVRYARLAVRTAVVITSKTSS